MAFLGRKEPFVPPERARVGENRQETVELTFACCGVTVTLRTNVSSARPARCPNRCIR